MLDLGYSGKRVIVSGCFSGMGEATARILLSLGAEVHGFDYKDCALDLAGFHRTDLRDPASIEASVAAVGGPVDALFNCAGLSQTAPPLEVMKVNFAGTRHLTECVIPLMTRGGAIASISSNSGINWTARLPLLKDLLDQKGFNAAVAWSEAHQNDLRGGYSTAKEAIIAWTLLSSQQLIGKGIRINCSLPGPTQTPMMPDFESYAGKAVLEFSTKPINRRSTPEEQAWPLVFLNSDMASYVNGVAFPVDGGFAGGVACGEIRMEDLRAAAAIK